jgi:Cu(I)/Ag(I) efflux system membrane fusion protein/cobalt-zinc-cadmium efflux system membrane fusion protein
MGEPLFSIYSPQLVTTQEEYLLAYQNYQRLSESSIADIRNSAGNLLDASYRRLRYWDITDAQIKDLERSGQVQKNLLFCSPVTGIIQRKNAVEGARFVTGETLLVIANLDKVWVLAYIYEYELPWVKKGQSVDIELPYIPGKKFSGKIDFIYPYLDSKTRNVKLRVVFDNPSFELKPDMFADIKIATQSRKLQLVVPSEAVIRTGKRNTVFLVEGGGKFRPRNIVLGPEGDGGLVAVEEGLSEGDSIVTSAQFLIDSESRLREALQKMLENGLAQE